MREVAALEPSVALPSVVCEPPKPAVHTLQRCSNDAAGGALVNIAKASRMAVGLLSRNVTGRSKSITAAARAIAAASMNGSVNKPMN